jgi:murein hydrolase activator
MKKRISLFLALVFSACFLFAQTEDKAQLEKERQDIQKEIKQIQGAYDKLKGKTRQIVGQYNLIDRKIKLQNKYISNISKELRMIDDDIYMSNVEIYRLSKLLDTLRAQYSRSVVYAYKNKSNYDFLNFIFSASSFNDAIKRVTYLKTYRTFREQQVNTIKETQALIAKRKTDQLSKKKQKDGALQNQTEQAKALEGQKKEKDVVLNQLKSQEKDLQKQLTAKKKKDKDLQKAITSIINREIAAAKAAAKKKQAEDNAKNVNPVTTDPNVSKNATTTTKPNVVRESVVFNTASDLKLNADFEKNRMRLPWPIDQGTVCIHYGPYQIEKTKIKGDNPGITICTPQPGNSVKSVFDGEVVSVFNIGDSKSVMIRHGKYFTVYSNLSSVTIAKGSNVSTGQSIGKVGVDEETGEGGKLEFLLMVENKKLNPEQWLHR